MFSVDNEEVDDDDDNLVEIVVSLSYLLANPKTWYPDSTSLITVALPIPLEAPVTMIDFVGLFSKTTWY